MLVIGAAAAIGVLGTANPGALRAADPPWEPPACSPGAVGAEAGAALGWGAWFALEPRLDAVGAVTGHELRLGALGGGRQGAAGLRAGRRIELAPEAFATGPYGAAILAGSDDGRQSRMRLLDTRLGCAIDAGESLDVVRSAVIAPDRWSIYEHRVDRATRRDLGVWRRGLGQAETVRVLSPLNADDRYGRTFGTELAWAADGRLAVVSCGELACRVRVLDPAGGAVAEAGAVGRFIGISGSEVIAYERCPGLPCNVEAVSPATGRHRVLAEGAGYAALADPALGTLVYEDLAQGVRTVDVASGRQTAIAPLAADLVPLSGGSGQGRGATVPAGWLALASLSAPSGPAAFLAVDPATLDARPVTQVLP
jgi:hypothetical protein